MNKQNLELTKRDLYIDEDVLSSAPSGVRGELVLFTVGKYMTDDELEKEYVLRELEPATIELIADFDVKNPTQIDEKKYVGTHWKDAKGNWCYAAFSRWDGRRRVGVYRSDDDDWNVCWWFAGVRSSSKSSELDSGTESLALAIEKLRVKYPCSEAQACLNEVERILSRK